jgi:hypothetical protein
VRVSRSNALGSGHARVPADEWSGAWRRRGMAGAASLKINGRVNGEGCLWLGGADTNSPLVDISPSEAVRRHIETWHGISAEFVQVTSEARIADHFRAPVHLLVVYEHGTRRCGESFVEGLPRSTLRTFARRFTLVPAGYEYREWQEPHTLSRLIFVYFDPANLPIDGHLGATELAPLLFFEDMTLPGTALKPRTAVESPASDNHRYFPTRGARWTQRRDNSISSLVMCKNIWASRYHWPRSCGLSG